MKYKNNEKIYGVEFCTQNWPVLLETLQVQFEEKACVGALKQTKNKKPTPSKLKGRALHWPIYTNPANPVRNVCRQKLAGYGSMSVQLIKSLKSDILVRTQ